MELNKFEKKHYYKVIFPDKIEAGLSFDGLTYIFEPKDIQDRLNTTSFPDTEDGESVWYFNSTKDRLCAEQNCNRILVNPTKVLDIFKSKPKCV